MYTTLGLAEAKTRHIFTGLDMGQNPGWPLSISCTALPFKYPPPAVWCPQAPWSPACQAACVRMLTLLLLSYVLFVLFQSQNQKTHS